MKNFEKLTSVVFYFLVFFGVSLTMYSLMQEKVHECSRQNISVDNNVVNEITINGDTTNRLYVVRDSTNGIVWVGFSGVDVIKK